MENIIDELEFASIGFILSASDNVMLRMAEAIAKNPEQADMLSAALSVAQGENDLRREVM